MTPEQIQADIWYRAEVVPMRAQRGTWRALHLASCDRLNGGECSCYLAHPWITEKAKISFQIKEDRLRELERLNTLSAAGLNSPESTSD